MNKDENIYKSKDYLFIFKTTIMVNKREKNLLYNFYFRQTAVLVLYFFNFIPFLLLFYSFSLPFSFIFPPLLDISERNFFPGGGGVHVHLLHPPAYAPANHSKRTQDQIFIHKVWRNSIFVSRRGERKVPIFCSFDHANLC